MALSVTTLGLLFSAEAEDGSCFFVKRFFGRLCDVLVEYAVYKVVYVGISEAIERARRERIVVCITVCNCKHPCVELVQHVVRFTALHTTERRVGHIEQTHILKRAAHIRVFLFGESHESLAHHCIASIWLDAKQLVVIYKTAHGLILHHL